MGTVPKNIDLPKAHDYVLKTPLDTGLSRCFCSSCSAQKQLAQKSHAFYPSKSAPPFRTIACKKLKQRKIVIFDDHVQVLKYDKSSGSIFENGKVSLCHGKTKASPDTETSTVGFRKREKCIKRCTRRSSNRQAEKEMTEYTKQKRNKADSSDQRMERVGSSMDKKKYKDTKRNASWNRKRNTIKASNNNKKRVNDDVVVL